MARVRIALILTSVLLLGPTLSACSNFDPESLDIFNLNEKKKLPGERKPLFPEGVPGVSQGIPPELVKGNHPTPEIAQSGTAAVTAEAAKEPEPKVKPKPRVSHKPKPQKPRVAKKPAPAKPAAQAQQSQPQQTGANSPWPSTTQQQQQQQQQQTGVNAPWPSATQAQTPSPWPSAPAPGTFQR